VSKAGICHSFLCFWDRYFLALVPNRRIKESARAPGFEWLLSFPVELTAVVT